MKFSVDTDMLFRYFSGLASPEEAMYVEDWRSLNEDNQTFFDELWRQWHQGTSFQKADIDLRLKEFNRKANIIKPKISIWKWLPYAAAILLFLSIGLYQFMDKPSIEYPNYSFQEYDAKFEILDGVYTQLYANASLQKIDSASFALKASNSQGKVFFDLTTFHPGFVLHLPSGLRVKDIGTRFTVELKEGLEIIHVHSGIVEVWNEQFKTEIHQQEIFTYDIAKREYIKQEHLISFNWKDKSLKSVSALLSQEFNMDVSIEDKQLAHKMLSLTGEDLSLSAIMDIISATLNVQYNFTKDKIVIKDL